VLGRPTVASIKEEIPSNDKRVTSALWTDGIDKRDHKQIISAFREFELPQPSPDFSSLQSAISSFEPIWQHVVWLDIGVVLKGKKRLDDAIRCFAQGTRQYLRVESDDRSAAWLDLSELTGCSDKAPPRNFTKDDMMNVVIDVEKRFGTPWEPAQQPFGLSNRQPVVSCPKCKKEMLVPGEWNWSCRYCGEDLQRLKVVSPNGQRIAYKARLGDKWVAVVDEVEGKPYDVLSANPILFSPDSRRTAYKAKPGDNWIAVIDGVEGKPYDVLSANPITFSPDSQRTVYAARLGDKWMVVVDGVEGNPYDGLQADSIAFSLDSRRTAYAGKIGGKWTVVVDGLEGDACDAIGKDSIAFSPDSQTLVYKANVGGKWTQITKTCVS
jgi:hypothetical protein